MSLLKAVVFDMDGVIVDSEAQWKAMEAEFFRTEVPGWTEEHHARIVGMSVEDLYHHLADIHGLKMSKREYLTRSQEVGRVVYQEKVVLAEGFREFLGNLRRRGVATAIASSSPRRWIDLVLERFGLGSGFDALVSANDVPAGRTKPHPDLYAEAARRLRLPPASCLAIEDSAIGLKSAKAAGLRAAALRSVHNREQDLSQAELELAGFSGLDFESLTARLAA